MKTAFWKNLLLICAGVVIGTLVASLTKSIEPLSWLSYGMSFGTQQPLTLQLGVLDITFGINIYITISSIIFVTLVYLVGRKLIK